MHGDAHKTTCSENGENSILQNETEIHDPNENAIDRLPLWRMTVVLASLFSFYVLESVAHVIADRVKVGFFYLNLFLITSRVWEFFYYNSKSTRSVRKFQQEKNFWTVVSRSVWEH